MFAGLGRRSVLEAVTLWRAGGVTTGVPNRHRDTLAVEAGDLGKEAAKLREAALARDERRATDALQRIQLMVRQLRAED